MVITFTLLWWHIPTFISLVTLIWAAWLLRNADTGFALAFVCIGLAPAFLVNSIAWMIAAIIK